jgi:hypothetical protein
VCLLIPHFAFRIGSQAKANLLDASPSAVTGLIDASTEVVGFVERKVVLQELLRLLSSAPVLDDVAVLVASLFAKLSCRSFWQMTHNTCSLLRLRYGHNTCSLLRLRYGHSACSLLRRPYGHSACSLLRHDMVTILVLSSARHGHSACSLLRCDMVTILCYCASPTGDSYGYSAAVWAYTQVGVFCPIYEL